MTIVRSDDWVETLPSHVLLVIVSVKPTTQTIFQANTAVRKARTHEVTLNYPSHFNISSSKIVAYTDSSFGNLPDGGSQGVFIFFFYAIRKGKLLL